MAYDSHQKAAEFHMLAAHAHQAAAAHHGKEDHLTAHEQSRQAMGVCLESFRVFKTGARRIVGNSQGERKEELTIRPSVACYCASELCHFSRVSRYSTCRRSGCPAGNLG
jgi:hypothetical protein